MTQIGSDLFLLWAKLVRELAGNSEKPVDGK